MLTLSLRIRLFVARLWSRSTSILVYSSRRCSGRTIVVSRASSSISRILIPLLLPPTAPPTSVPTSRRRTVIVVRFTTFPSIPIIVFLWRARTRIFPIRVLLVPFRTRRTLPVIVIVVVLVFARSRSWSRWVLLAPVPPRRTVIIIIVVSTFWRWTHPSNSKTVTEKLNRVSRRYRRKRSKVKGVWWQKWARRRKQISEIAS